MRHLWWLLLPIIVFSCRSEAEKTIFRAEKLLTQAPDSALVVLESLDRTALDGSDAAYYDYVHASAFYRCYFFLDNTEEQALLDAGSYYEVHGPGRRAIACWDTLAAARAATGNHSGSLAAMLKSSQASRQLDKARSSRAVLLLFIVAVLSTLVLFFYAKKLQAQRQLSEEQSENERLLSTAEDLRRQLSSRRRDSSTLDRLCEQYYVHEGTDNLQPKILKEVRDIIEAYRTDSKERRALEASLDGDGTITALRETFPKWKEEDFNIYIFIAAGFSATTIAALLEKDKPYVYNRLYRIKERIKTVPDADRFLALL